VESRVEDGHRVSARDLVVLLVLAAAAVAGRYLARMDAPPIESAVTAARS
jgi:hypothetical protein